MDRFFIGGNRGRNNRLGNRNSKGASMGRRIAHGIENKWTFAVGLLLLLMFIAPFSRLVYNPEAVEIAGDKVTMYRSFPGDTLGLPRPWLSYVETVRPLTPEHNGGQSCTDKGGPFKYDRAGPVGDWSIEWAADCTSDIKGFAWSARWYWHVGAIKFAPATFEHVVLKTQR